MRIFTRSRQLASATKMVVVIRCLAGITAFRRFPAQFVIVSRSTASSDESISSHLLRQHRVSEHLDVAGIICRHHEGFVVRSARKVRVSASRLRQASPCMHKMSNEYKPDFRIHRRGCVADVRAPVDGG